jgi:hypothetical protein
MIIDKRDKNGENIFFKTLINALNGDKTAKQQFQVGIQAFMSEPITQKVKIQALTDKIKIQSFTVSTDLPFLTGESFNLTEAANVYDLGFEEAFQVVPKIQGKRFWSDIAIQNALGFVKVPEGGRISVVGLSGTKVFFMPDKFGGAIGWTYEAIEGREILQLIKLSRTFINRYYENRANIAYALLQAAAITNPITTYDPGADGELRRDMRTINQAMYDLTFRLRNKGYGDMASAPVIIYANPLREARINAALRASTSEMANVLGGAQQVNGRPKKVIYTYNAAITPNRPMMVFPGWGLSKMDYMLPTTFTDKQDILTLNIAQSVWGDYGFGIADTEQVQNFILT